MAKKSKQAKRKEALDEIKDAADAITDLCDDEEVDADQFAGPLTELRQAIAALAELEGDDDSDDEEEEE